jgi:hypothetical protein
MKAVKPPATAMAIYGQCFRPWPSPPTRSIKVEHEHLPHPFSPLSLAITHSPSPLAPRRPSSANPSRRWCRSPSSSPLHRRKALPEVRSKVRKATPPLNRAPRVVPWRTRSPDLGRPPWPPRCVLRRLASRRKRLCESLMCSSSFWYPPRRVWCTGGHVRMLPSKLRRAAAVSGRAPPPPAPQAACSRCRPPDRV